MSLVVRVIAPTGRDAELITTVLRHNDVPAQVGINQQDFAATLL